MRFPCDIIYKTTNKHKVQRVPKGTYTVQIYFTE